MIDHLSLQCDDLARSAAFYDAVLATLGATRMLEHDGAIGYGVKYPSFWLGPLSDEPVNRAVHLAFRAPDRASVDAFRDAAVAYGAEVLHEPKEWPDCHADYYAAFVRHPDGHNVEAVCHVAE